jgi:competence protein ComEC
MSENITTSKISNHPFIFLISVMVITGLCLGGIFAAGKTRRASPATVNATKIETAHIATAEHPSKTSTQKWTDTNRPTTPTYTETITTNIPVLATETPLNTEFSYSVHFVDVGQGDSILIISPVGEKILIDGGSKDSGLIQYLDHFEIQDIDTMIATHPHEDHIGGLIQVLEKKLVKRVFTNGEMYTISTFEQFLDAIANAKAEYFEVKRGDVIEAGGLSFYVLSPGELSGNDANHNSLVLRMSYGGTTFLFMGDADMEAENEILAQGLTVKAEILKIGHHGSCASTGEKFLKMVDPDVAITSVGENNQYGLPCPDTITKLQEAGIKAFYTETNGTIVVNVDSSGYTINNMDMQELWRKP